MHRFLALLSLAPAALAAPSLPVAAVDAGHVSAEIRPGATCDGIGPQVSLDDARVRDTTLVQPFARGCGCPSGPVYTLLYEPGTAPLEVRVCEGPGEDPCEAFCTGELVWDLADVLRSEQARVVRIAD